MRESRRRSNGLFPLLFLFLVLAGGCAPQETGRTNEEMLTVLDSLLADLSGAPLIELSRGQRWRLIASVGTGLPPTGYRLEDLPEPGSRAAALQQAYCLQCHGPSSPRMHSADEWPVLVRRMLARGVALRDRLGGPRTEGMIDAMLLAGLRRAEIPSAEDTDSLIAYFRRNALPAARPGEIGDGPEADLYVERCSICHETPSPAAHGPEGAVALVSRMSALMAMLGMQPLTEGDKNRIVAFLQQSAP